MSVICVRQSATYPNRRVLQCTSWSIGGKEQFYVKNTSFTIQLKWGSTLFKSLLWVVPGRFCSAFVLIVCHCVHRQSPYCFCDVYVHLFYCLWPQRSWWPIALRGGIGTNTINNRAGSKCVEITVKGSLLTNAKKSRILRKCEDSWHFESLKCNVFKTKPLLFSEESWQRFLWNMPKWFEVRIPDKHHDSRQESLFFVTIPDIICDRLWSLVIVCVRSERP